MIFEQESFAAKPQPKKEVAKASVVGVMIPISKWFLSPSRRLVTNIYELTDLLCHESLDDFPSSVLKDDE